MGGHAQQELLTHINDIACVRFDAFSNLLILVWDINIGNAHTGMVIKSKHIGRYLNIAFQKKNVKVFQSFQRVPACMKVPTVEVQEN